MKCLSDDELRASAEDGTVAKPVLDHLSECVACQQRLNELCEDMSVLEEMRVAWKSRLDESTARHIDEICRDATEK